MAGARGLPPRIWIVGPPGAGKSSVADVLARRLGVEATHLDDLHWEPGWKERSSDDLARRVESALAAPAWVVDGNYLGALRSFMTRADLVLWIDLPLSVCVPRLLLRTAD